MNSPHKCCAFAFGLLGLALLTQGGCDHSCDPGGVLLDNTDGHLDSDDKDYADYVCVYFTPSPPPPPLPDLGGIKPPDPPGPKDPEAVVKAALFVESCINRLRGPNINERIDETYAAIQQVSLDRAIAERVDCFKDKANGCEAVRECLGVVVTLDEPVVEDKCNDGIRTRQTTTPNLSHTFNEWYNCDGLGLECDTRHDVVCRTHRELCDPATYTTNCEGEVPRMCLTSPSEVVSSVHERPSCTNFGLTCAIDANQEAMCTGDGPACDLTFDDRDYEYYVDFRAGIACEDATTLRACVKGHEKLVDCTTLGKGFSCIGGSRPRCGLDFQCDAVNSFHHHINVPNCEGSSVVLCNAGVWTTIDCKSLGFDGCDPGSGFCFSGERL